MNRSKSYSLAKESAELRKLILENPDLPICVLAGEDASADYWGWTFCSSVSFEICEILDCDYYDNDGLVVCDRGRLAELIEDDLYNEYSEKTEEEYQAAIQRELEKFEPYWLKVIAIYATN